MLPVELMVSEPEPFFIFLCFFIVLFMLPVSLPIVLLPVLLEEVFCAKTAQTGRSERPMAAIMIFFIWGYFLIYLSCSTSCSH